MITCRSRIVKEYDSKKAGCYWPKTIAWRSGQNVPVDNPLAEGFPECGGSVSLTVVARERPDFDGDRYFELEVESSCSRCQWPYWDGRLDTKHGDNEALLTKIINEYYADRE